MTKTVTQAPAQKTEVVTLAAAGIQEVIQDGLSTVIFHANPVSFYNPPSYFPYTTAKDGPSIRSSLGHGDEFIIGRSSCFGDADAEGDR